MRTSLRTSLTALMVLALGLTACRETAPATETPRPVFPTITPTTLPPTLTPVPSATVPATATAKPTASPTMDLARLYPTLTPRAGTPTPTPKTVNGTLRVWWADLLVKQPDGSYMAPEAVLQSIRDDFAELQSLKTARDFQSWKTTAQWFVAGNDVWAERYFIGLSRKLVLEAPSPQVNIIVTNTVKSVDIRAFSADGLSAYLLVDLTSAIWAVYSTSDWTLIDPARRSSFDGQLWRIRFDLTDGRWKYEELVATPKR